MQLKARLAELARVKSVAPPVVSVYLDTRWEDEHQRDRVRLFLKNELKRARQGAGPRCAEPDLGWIEAQGEALVSQERLPAARGVAMFACGTAGLREVLPVRVPFDNAFVVAEAPHLAPLTEALEEAPPSLVVFVDGESARLVPLTAEGAGAEIRLESEVPGHHRRGGWAQLAQSRYQRHIQDHRGRHFEAVAQSLIALAEGNGVERIVVAGEPRNITALRQHLPPRLLDRVAGTLSAARREAMGAILGRAAELLVQLEKAGLGAAVDAALTEAAKGGRAVAGVGPTLEAVGRGAVRRLYLLKGFREQGRACAGCGAVGRGVGTVCAGCGGPAAAVELGAACVDRVIAAGGGADLVEPHEALARAGGMAALLRYPL
ncbi:MAG: hypothetical protein HYV93_20505 [Candidatus Rokubacteria bacterium]|nr:hypothetical protein [Candidatus Rokubacteria bacterium]